MIKFMPGGRSSTTFRDTCFYFPRHRSQIDTEIKDTGQNTEELTDR